MAGSRSGCLPRSRTSRTGPHGRYWLSCEVQFEYLGDEVAAQAATGAVRYDISHDPARGRWHVDASWRTPAQPPAEPTLTIARY